MDEGSRRERRLVVVSLLDENTRSHGTEEAWKGGYSWRVGK